MPDTIPLVALAEDAWKVFAEPYRASFVGTIVLTTNEDGDLSDADTYMPEAGEQLPDVLDRVEARGRTRIIVVSAMPGNSTDPLGQVTGIVPWKFTFVADKDGHSYAIAHADHMPRNWTGEVSGPLYAEMVAALQEPADLDAELNKMLGRTGNDDVE